MSPEAFQQLGDRLADPVFLVNGLGRVLAVNSAGRHLADGIEDTDLSERVEDPSGLRRYLALCTKSPERIPGTLRLLSATEEWRCHGSALPGDGRHEPLVLLHLHPRAGSIRRFIALNEHIDRLNAEVRRNQALEDEREKLLEKEREAREAAEQASRLKEDFLATVSHELRTPLNAIQGWVTVLREQLRDLEGDTKPIARGLDVIERNCAAQSRLVEDLMDVSRIVSGRTRLDVQPLDLSRVVREALETVRPAAEARNIRLHFEAEPECCDVMGDEERLLQVIWNLLSNAVKFTPRGGEVWIRLRHLEDQAEIEVADDGEGIDGELLPFIFDRFRQGDGSSTRRHGGLGLGLSIVRHLTELHGGRVDVSSDGLGEGSRFVVRLPLPSPSSPGSDFDA